MGIIETELLGFPSLPHVGYLAVRISHQSGSFVIIGEPTLIWRFIRLIREDPNAGED